MEPGTERVLRMSAEHGAIMLTTLFFLIGLFGLLSLVLLVEQADVAEMRVQQTADVISKGARRAGEWTFVDPSGETRRVLFATKQEALRHDADIVRGAREEAGLLADVNRDFLLAEVDQVEIDHQKGESRSLYSQGIYHVAMEVSKQVELVWESLVLSIRRVSQSGVYDSSW